MNRSLNSSGQTRAECRLVRSDGKPAAAQRLEAEHFEPHIGKTFRFEGARLVLTLDRVIREGASPLRGSKRQPFTLIFRAPKAREVLCEGFYACEVEGGPSFSLYVAPIHSPAPNRQDYQAVFN